MIKLNFKNNNIKGLENMNEEEIFFIQNFLNITQMLYDKGELSIKEFLKLQDLTFKEVLNEVGGLVLNHELIDDKLNLTVTEQLTFFDDFSKEIKSKYSDLASNQNNILDKKLNEIGANRFNFNTMLLSIGKAKEIPFVNVLKEGSFKEIVDNRIDGLTFKDRNFRNNMNLVQNIKSHLYEFLKGNNTKKELIKNLNALNSLSKMQIKRIVRNEICNVQHEMNEKWFQDNNMDKLLYSACLDLKTCSICSKHDGKTYERTDINRPKLPIHVNDRCCYIPIPNSDYRPQHRTWKNEEGVYKTIKYKTYEDWIKEHN